MVVGALPPSALQADSPGIFWPRRKSVCVFQGLDDLGKLCRLEARPADKGTVDIGDGKDLGRVGGFDRAAVKQADGVGRVRAKAVGQAARRKSWTSAICALVGVRPVPMAQIGS